MHLSHQIYLPAHSALCYSANVMPIVRIEPHYKLTIPKEARDALHLEVGEEVETITTKDSITFRRKKTPSPYTPTKRELRAIEEGRAAFRRGEYYTLEEFKAHVAGTRKKTSTKKRSSRPAA